MNLLSNSYQDDGYRHYQDVEPLLAVCVVGKNVELLEQSLKQTEGEEHPLRLSHADSFGTLKPKRVKSTTRGVSRGLLKTDWCYKHQYQRFSNIVIGTSWETFASNGLTPELSNLLEDANEYLVHSNCGVTVALLAAVDEPPHSEAKLVELTAALRVVLGRNLAGVVILGKNGASATSSAILRKRVVEAAFKYHRDEIARLRERKRVGDPAGLDIEEGGTGTLVRKHFKCGWHHLVLREYFEARKHMKKAYKIIRTLYPKFASLEARVCASITLYHSVSIAPFCAEDVSDTGTFANDIQRHIEWLGEAFTSDYSPNCCALLRSIRGFLVAGWQEILAERWQNSTAAIRRDYFFAAANSLEEILADVPVTTEERFDIPPPPFMGTECANDAYASVVLSTISRAEVALKIADLLDRGRAVGVTSDAHDLERECLLFQIRLVTSAEGLKLDAPTAQKMLSLNWKTGLVTTTVCRAVLTGSEQSSEECVAAGIHLLADSNSSAAEKCALADRLAQLRNAAPLSFTLEYPRGALTPPVTVVPSFSTFACEAVNERIALQLIFTSTIPLPVTVEHVAVTLSDIHSEGSELEVVFPVLTTAIPRVKNEFGVLTQSFEFPRSGDYFCARVCATVTVSGTPLRVLFRFSATEESELRGMPLPLPLPMRGCRVVQVAKPASFASLEFPGGELIECIEGEGVDIEFTVNARNSQLSQCGIELPARTSLYSCSVSDPKVRDAVMESSLSRGETEAAPIYSIHDFGSATSAKKELILHMRGLRSGMYVIPVVFHYSVNSFEHLKVTKDIHVAVDPPFSAAHSYFCTEQWHSGAGVVHLPATASVSTQVEKNVLMKLRPAVGTGTVSGVGGDLTGTGGVSLYYAAVDRTQATTGSTPYVIPFGEPVLISSQLMCTARNGVSVQKLDVVCVDGVELMYTSVGKLPCHLECGEAASLVAKISVATRAGQFSPGFVRVLLSPVGASMELLVVDLPLPPLTTEHPKVWFSYTYPEITVARVPFTLGARLYNDTSAPFVGEVALETNSDEFVVSGRCRWRLDIEPHDLVAVEVVLIPIHCGTFILPSLQLRDNAVGAPNRRAASAHTITVVPGDHKLLT